MISTADIYAENRLPFSICIVVALLLHALIFVSVNLVPKSTVVFEHVPETLHIKLGSGDELFEMPAAEVMPVPKAEEVVEDTLNLSDISPATGLETPVIQKAPPPKKAAEKKPEKKVEKKAKPKAVAKKYDDKAAPPKQATKDVGETLGNTKAEAAHLATRYSQQLSLWVDKFKVYPHSAQQAGMEGETHVRLRIDRRGNIRYQLISHNAPYPILDKAALDAVRRANPVPAIPVDFYPNQSQFEFIIPIRFYLK